MNILILIFYLIKLTISISLHFPNPLQRFVYDQSTETIILASVNHIYSLNANDLSILSDIDTSPSKIDHPCLNINRTSPSKNLYYFSTSSYLTPTVNQTFNQLLLRINNSILICSTSNRGRSCQLRSLSNLHLLRNSSQRLVSSSPLYPTLGFVNQNNQILYLANTYDAQCDPFYEIPTISGRHLNEKDFLALINLNSGRSALQQSTYTLRLLNIRLIKDFFLYYLYAFEYKHFSYFLTIQQSDLHHRQQWKLQTKILRFCQTSKQPIIKSYVEVPLTCGKDYHYLITAKFSNEKKILYGLFRNTTLANLSSTSHAICTYSIDDIQQGFFQTIKRCLVDGKGYRGLGFISPDTHCISNKNLNEITEDYCPDEEESFSQYPIGGHRSIEQTEPIIQLNDRVNFTAIEIGTNGNEKMIFVGDDRGTVHTFHTSNTNEIYKQHFQSKIIIDLQLIHHVPTLKNAKLIVLTDNQIIKQSLSVCEQYSTCNECSNSSLCHWCSQENRCTATFECADEYKNTNRMNMCIHIERVVPEIISIDTLSTEVIVNTPLGGSIDEYLCRFTFHEKEEEEFYQTKAVLNDKTIKCSPPLFNKTTLAIYHVILSIYQIRTNLTFGYYPLKFLNCSNFHSCSSCTSSFNLCSWNRRTTKCLSQSKEKLFSAHHLTIPNQCPSLYLQPSRTHLAYRIDKILIIQIEQCNSSTIIQSCQLADYRKRFSLTAFNPILINRTNSCSLECHFQWLNSPQILFHRPINLHLSIEFSNQTTLIIPNTHISLYQCEHLASNCSSCSQLNPSYGCIWCNNQCLFKNQSLKCLNNHECRSPMIEKVEPLILPIHGGTLVTIGGNYFDLFHLAIDIAGIACQLIEEESSSNKIVCQSGNAGSRSRTGFVRLKFGSSGPQIHSHQMISYIKPKFTSIKPLNGIQNGGTILTIHGENFTIGNSHISVLIGNRLCQLLSISPKKIECKTRSFPALMLNKTQSIQVLFDRQTNIIYKESFTISPNPILYSFDQYRSFTSGGHRLIISGDNFHSIQTIQLEFHHLIFISPLFRNNTHLIFITPSIKQLNLKKQQEIEITIYLDHFNRTSSLIYLNDPVIYELQPIIQPYTNRLIIRGTNFTAIGHTENEISVHIGCDLCPIVHLQSNEIICQPPRFRPEKYSNTKHLCYNSEHPSIIVSIDNLHSHVGFLIYPKKILLLGLLTGCLVTISFIVLLILLVVCWKIRNTQQKYHQQYFYTHRLASPHQIEKVSQSINPSLLSIRSYVNYLQFCYSKNQFFSNEINDSFNEGLLEQFRSLITNNNQFIDYLFQHAIQSKNKRILNHLILTQRYNLKNLFRFHDDFIDLNICILISYDLFSINHIHSLVSQLYSQLKSKIHSGPIDTIEPTMSYYSLNINTMIHDQSIFFKSIQLLIHIDSECSFNLTCLTCDTISQVKEKILSQLNLSNKIFVNDCQVYLLTNSSCSSSSSTASSSVPLVRKSLLTQAIFHRTLKYSTTTINDLYRESNSLLLNDIDNTNEQKKLNTLHHYGILTDGYEMKIILPNLDSTVRSSCHYCSLSVFNYLTLPSSSEPNRSEYIHLLHHTYEEIENKNPNEIYRLFETKSIIYSVLINLIENLFTNLIHYDLYISELMKEHRQIFHAFYAHLIPFVFRSLHCLFDISVDKCLNSSLDILATIFQIACDQQTEHNCSLCIEFYNDENSKLNIQNCTLVFADEIQRVRLYYSNLEGYLKNQNLVSEYSSTNTGIDQTFELDNSIFTDLMEYSYVHANEIIEHLKNQSSDGDVLSMFLNLIYRYRSNERT